MGGVAVAVAVAALSLWLVERPFLRLKVRLARVYSYEPAQDWSHDVPKDGAGYPRSASVAATDSHDSVEPRSR